MARCKKGKRGNPARISSRAAQNMPNGCFDVCTDPICAEPDVLSLMAPLIYDEIGINLCTTFDLGTDIPATYPTATNATVRVVDVAYTYGDGNVEVSSITGRPNCYDVTLSNLTVTFACNLYDANCNLLATLYPTATYLPADTADPAYDEDTNPASVDLEIFAPYGTSYNEDAAGGTLTAALNYIGFLSGDNMVRQGLNLYAVPKLLDLDTADSTITVGLTLVLQSLYFAGYNVVSDGRIQTPKGDITPEEDTLCMHFVAGDLLNLEIKPLDLNPPACEGELKKDCDEGTACGTCPGSAQFTEDVLPPVEEQVNR